MNGIEQLKVMSRLKFVFDQEAKSVDLHQVIDT